MKPKKSRIDKESTRSRRMLELLMLILHSRSPVSLSSLNEEKWGSKRTLTRLLQNLQDMWLEINHDPLYEIVSETGGAPTRGERFIRLASANLQTVKAERLAFIAAYLQFAPFQGTIFEAEMTLLQNKMADGLSRKDKLFLKRIAKKFVYIGKGTKPYAAKADVIDEIYAGLLHECLVKVTVQREAELKSYELMPLGLIYSGNSLYLLANRSDLDADQKPFHWLVDKFTDVTCLRDKPFKYPLAFDAKSIFEKSFGIFSGPSSDDRQPIQVELCFVNDPEVKAYVRAREYTTGYSLIENVNGTLSLKLAVQDLTEIKSWILSWGHCVEVVQPQILRTLIEKEASKIQALYSA